MVHKVTSELFKVKSCNAFNWPLPGQQRVWLRMLHFAEKASSEEHCQSQTLEAAHRIALCAALLGDIGLRDGKNKLGNQSNMKCWKH